MTPLLAIRILYFGPFRGVMKIRIAVTLVVLGLLHTYIWALASALAPSGKESPRENEDPVF